VCGDERKCHLIGHLVDEKAFAEVRVEEYGVEVGDQRLRGGLFAQSRCQHVRDRAIRLRKQIARALPLAGTSIVLRTQE
jgi:hypothetical protein